MEVNDRFNIANYKRRPQDPPNFVHLFNNRQFGLNPKSVPKQFEQFGELKASTSKLEEMVCHIPYTARSTFLISFSPDGSKVASTHGDHNIYISDVITGMHVKKLEGHTRTPWCITFHPTCSSILASGCLSGEVRVWDLEGGSERWRTEREEVIASIAFHPIRQLLVIATGSRLYFWDWSESEPTAHCSTNSEFERVRYVKFDKYGHKLITGISNFTPNRSTLNHRLNGTLYDEYAHRRERERVFYATFQSKLEVDVATVGYTILLVGRQPNHIACKI